MTKKLTARIGSYQKDGKTVGRYADVGVILNGDNGEYALISPTVDLSGVLQLQNLMALNEGKQQRDKIMCGIYENQQQGQQNNAPQQNHQQQAPQQNNGAQNQNYAPQNQGYQQQDNRGSA